MPPAKLPLRPMQALSLQLPVETGGWYPSLLMDYEEGDSLTVGEPTHGGRPLNVRVGAEIGVELPLADGLRRFRVRVEERAASPPSLRLSWPGEMERLQRRENVRVPVQLRTAARSLAEEGAPAGTLEGETSDLSAGGMRVLLPEEVPAGSEVTLTLHVPEGEPQQCHAVVLRCGRMARPRGEYRYWIAVAYTAVAPAVQREITRLVFDVQRDLLRRDVL